MAKRQNILSVDYITDDDTGIYRIGEIDFGVSGMLDVYLHENGRKGMDNILKTLCHLIWHVQQYGYPMIKNKNNKMALFGMFRNVWIKKMLNNINHNGRYGTSLSIVFPKKGGK